MHLSEGVLSSPVLLTGGILAVAGTAIGLRTLDYERIMAVSLLTSAFFVASLIHVPIGPGNVHLILGGLMGLVLGWSCFPAILVALMLQALFFQFGGVTVLGVNTCVIALPPLLCYYLFRPMLDGGKRKRPIAAFSAGFFSILLSSLMMALALAFTDQGFLPAAKLLVGMHLPLAVIEGIITMFAVSFIAKVQPDFLAIKNI